MRRAAAHGNVVTADRAQGVRRSASRHLVELDARVDLGECGEGRGARGERELTRLEGPATVGMSGVVVRAVVREVRLGGREGGADVRLGGLRIGAILEAEVGRN